jgi:hypothetical protein
MSFASHFVHAVPSSAVLPKRTISGNTATSVTTPISVIANPTKPIPVNVANAFTELASALFRTALNTNRTDKDQFTNSPTQKPSAVAIMSKITSQVSPTLNKEKSTMI